MMEREAISLQGSTFGLRIQLAANVLQLIHFFLLAVIPESYKEG